VSNPSAVDTDLIDGTAVLETADAFLALHAGQGACADLPALARCWEALVRLQAMVEPCNAKRLCGRDPSRVQALRMIAAGVRAVLDAARNGDLVRDSYSSGRPHPVLCVPPDGVFPFDRRGVALLEIGVRQLRQTVPAKDPQAGTQYVRLDQMAALVSRKKRTAEKWKTRKKDPLPPPDVEGTGGNADEWLYQTVRPWLERNFRRTLPEKFPTFFG
jgi:hypothetical protein